MLNIKKTNAPILIKFSDGRTEEQTDESDFIGRYRTNVECPINKQYFNEGNDDNNNNGNTPALTFPSESNICCTTRAPSRLTSLV